MIQSYNLLRKKNNDVYIYTLSCFVIILFIIISASYGVASEKGISFQTKKELSTVQSNDQVSCKISDGKILIDFEGLVDGAKIRDAYKSCGVIFSGDALSLIDSDSGGNGNFANEASPDTVLFFLENDKATLNFADGIVNGFSFFYSAIIHPGYIRVYSEENRQGELLAELSLPTIPHLGKGDPNGYYDNWQNIGVKFKGIAKSIDFGGTANYIGFDNITLNSASAADTKVSYFEFSNIEDQKTNSMFTITIAARDQYGNSVPSFNKRVDLFSDPYVQIRVENESGVVFSNGIWTGKIRILQSMSNLSLTARYNEVTGKSNQFKVYLEEEVCLNCLAGKVFFLEKPIIDATITLKQFGEKEIFLKSDKDGFYEVHDIPSGLYLISASKIINDKEFKSFEDKIQIHCSTSNQHNIYLRSDKKPLLIVPGILGSTNKESEGIHYPKLNGEPGSINSSDLKIFNPDLFFGKKWPVGVQFFTKLFEDEYEIIDVPYDWRLPITEIAEKYLVPAIKNAIENSGYPKVDIVAHSMGGLVTRAYIQDKTIENYNNDIDKFVMLGTPNAGSCDIYIILEGGDPKRVDDIKENLPFNVYHASMKYQWEQFKDDKYKEGNKVKEFLREKILSANQLMPTYDFLHRKKATDNPQPVKVMQNIFLKYLNDDQNKERMVADSSICKENEFCVETRILLSSAEDTIQGINVLEKTNEIKELWPDGEPYEPKGEKEAIKGENNGDGTVSAYSARGPFASKSGIPQTKFNYKSSHAGMFKDAGKDAYLFLTGKTIDKKGDALQAEDFPDSRLIFYTRGQVQPFLTNPSGNNIGVNFDTFETLNNIEGAQLSLSPISSSISIDEPVEGKYMVQLKGPVEEDFMVYITYYDYIHDLHKEISFKQHYKGDIITIKFNIEFDSDELIVLNSELLPPTKLKALNKKGITHLEWQPSPTKNINHYNIYMRSEGQKQFTLLHTTSETNFTTKHPWCTNKDCLVRYYRVTAQKDNQESSFSNTAENQYAINADFTANLVSGNLPLIVQFTDLSEGNIDSWNWDFNYDGKIDSYDQNPKYSFKEEGKYTISLKVSGEQGKDKIVKYAYISVKKGNILPFIKLLLN